MDAETKKGFDEIMKMMTKEYPAWLEGYELTDYDDIDTDAGIRVVEKKCPVCGSEYTRSEFLALSSPDAGSWQVDFIDEDLGKKIWWPIRNCSCGSSLCLNTICVDEDGEQREMLV